MIGLCIKSRFLRQSGEMQCRLISSRGSEPPAQRNGFSGKIFQSDIRQEENYPVVFPFLYRNQ